MFYSLGICCDIGFLLSPRYIKWREMHQGQKFQSPQQILNTPLETEAHGKYSGHMSLKASAQDDHVDQKSLFDSIFIAFEGKYIVGNITKWHLLALYAAIHCLQAIPMVWGVSPAQVLLPQSCSCLLSHRPPVASSHKSPQSSKSKVQKLIIHQSDLYINKFSIHKMSIQ